jgi:RNA polymerase sigma-70 factor (ECF subfamily)
LKSQERDRSTDEELMVAYRDGDAGALDELYRRYQGPIFGFAYRYMGNADQAQDVLQETFLRVHRGREQYSPSSKFSSWLFRIARNLCIDEKRRYWNRRVMAETEMAGRDPDADTNVLQSFADDGTTASEKLGEDEVARRIRAAIEQLSDEQREVMILSKYQDMTYREIGDILGISTESVKQRAYRAHMRLRELLADLVEHG